VAGLVVVAAQVPVLRGHRGKVLLVEQVLQHISAAAGAALVVLAVTLLLVVQAVAAVLLLLQRLQVLRYLVLAEEVVAHLLPSPQRQGAEEAQGMAAHLP